MDLTISKSNILLSKEEREGIETWEVIRIFNESTDLNEVKEAVKNSKDRLFLSWDTVEVRDKDGEIIPVDDYLVDSYKKYIKRGGNISINHSNKSVGQTLAFKVLNHPQNNKPAIMSLNKIHSDYNIDNQIWTSIKNGITHSVSVGGETNERTETKIDGQDTGVLGNIDIYEKAVTPRPCNPMANNIAVSLAKEDLNKPFLHWESFSECVLDMKGEGYDEETANKICGKLQSQHEKKELEKQEQEERDKLTKEILEKLEQIEQKLAQNK